MNDKARKVPSSLPQAAGTKSAQLEKQQQKIIWSSKAAVL